MNNRLLEVNNLKMYFFLKRGIVRAVDGVSFSIDKGQSLGLVGESGCGKTITAMSIMRLEPKPAGKIVGGKIMFEGEDLVQKTETQMRRIRGKKIAIIMQDPMTSLNPVFTIGNQIEEAVKLHMDVKGRESIKQRVIESLEQVRIPAAETRMRNYPHQMSGGMRQRVVGAMAISCQPSLLIADEPTTSLDVTTQAQYLRLLKQVQQETGVALIFITHDLGIVVRMCDYVCVMYLGKIIEKAGMRELWHNPRHPYTVALMKSVPKIETKTESLYSIEGMVPSLLEMPLGCSFHPRCEKATELCQKEYPPEKEISEGHFVSCWSAWETYD
jgi:oligopeptide/dipeptide ABC transporter ATP-binding protein